MKRFFLFLIFVIFVNSESKAANDFQRGYIITLKNDTIYGKIDNTNYFQHSQSCTFKNSKTNEITTYYPSDITGYRFIDGKFYVSKRITIQKTKTLIFMEYLINGKLDLFFRQDQDGTNHYYAAKDTVGIEELDYSKKTIQENGKTWENENKKYIGLLSYLTFDCPEMQQDLKKMNEPDNKTLINFAKKYHNLTCTDETCIIYEKRIPRKIKLQAWGAMNVINPGFLDNSELFISSKNLYQSWGFNILVQQSQQSESLYFGLGVERISSNNSDVLYLLPLSINYLNARMGFSPTYSFSVDLNTLCLTQSFKAGLKYQMRKFSIDLTANMKTYTFVRPYIFALNLGVTYNLK